MSLLKQAAFYRMNKHAQTDQILHLRSTKIELSLKKQLH